METEKVKKTRECIEVNIVAPNIFSGDYDELTNSELLRKFFRTKSGKFMLRSVLIRFLLGLVLKIANGSVSRHAAQMAYYFLFAMLPMTIVLFGLMQMFPIPEEKVIELISRVAPEEVEHVMTRLIEGNSGEAQLAILSLGFIVMLWSASSGMNAVLFSINEAYGIKVHEAYLKRKVRSILLATGMIISIIGSLLVIVYGKQIANFFMNILGVSLETTFSLFIFSWIIFMVVLFIAFFMIYWLGPNVKVKFIYALPGAIFASSSWLISSLLFSYYADHFANYASVYGSIAGIMMLMIWFFITGLVLTIGGEINAFFEYTLRIRRNDNKGKYT